jgi:hypothetical protein
MVGHHGLPQPAMRREDLTVEVPPLAQFRSAVGRLNQFGAACRRRGIDVVYSYPPMAAMAYERSSGAVEEIHRALHASLDIPIVNHPRDTAFPHECFFDSIGHLGEDGKRLRSEVLLRGLGASRVTEVATPRAPARTTMLWRGLGLMPTEQVNPFIYFNF